MEKKNIKGIFKAQNNKKKVSVSLAISNELKEKIKKIAEEEITVSAKKLINTVGLSEKINSYPCELSGGQKQRVAIARALVNQPVLLIADEPTGNLDPVTSEDIMKLFNEINHMGTTIIMVTHNKELVNSMHKRVVSIEEGHIISDVKKGGYDLHV